MVSTIHMPTPMCLIENRGKEFRVCQEALQLLSEIHQPVVVVAIVGLYRTGKSYLMNKLAGKTSGFALGSKVQANTKGIWMWCIPHPKQPSQTLVLLDTEGLGDVEKGDPKNDTWIFALTLLLSSTLVYNSIGTIDQYAMNQLHYVTELTEHIKAKVPSRENAVDGLEDSAEFVRFFPDFIWSLRDFTLCLELDGQPISADDYLERALTLKKGDSHDIELFNLPRKCIRMFFPTRKCFIFERPTSRKNLSRLDQMQESELDPDFVEQAGQFCSYVYCTSKAKTIPGGHVLNGRLLAKLAETYVDTLRSGKVPCMENAVLALADRENSAAVADATARYVELMERRLKLPTETLEELLRIHAGCEEEALRVFMARAFKDDTRQFQAQLMKTLDERKEEYCSKNEKESSRESMAVLKALSQEIEKNIRTGRYSQPGGHQHFLQDMKKLEERYHQKPKKGLMAMPVLQQFLKAKEDVGRAILQSDKALSENEKRMKEAQARAKEAQREQESQRQQLAVLEQKRADQERSFEMNLEELRQKLQQERKQILEEQEKVMDCKLKEQEKMLKNGFQREANQLKEEVQLLREQNDEKQESFITTGLHILAEVASLYLPGFLGKAVGFVSNLLRRL
ncbi:guanylate-binding protein 1-like [Varanus komodoensis]|uniref:guanylate-binding protein 1-like n=1 Tax=Varanus komodoensis TaxID=61221 RepID=UPI001CF77B5B|nr:guanylate-binding protein 1-like [Varanus komodoensis]XP_044290831.1 guanylate-binding protein 1-like [Varanus komodoensis]